MTAATPRHDESIRDQVVLITGAAGRMGTYLRVRLARPGRLIRLLDISAVTGVGDREEAITASVTDLAAVRRAMKDADAVIHLGGHSDERPWEDILDVNIVGARTVFEAARLEGVGRVVYASSNHAVGYYEYQGGELPDGLPPRPDSLYGLSKAFGESLGSLYHDRHGLDVVCVRIGSCFDEPTNSRMLETWLSPDDAGRLFEAALSPATTGFHVIWGVSDNSHRWWSLESAKSIGYRPQDRAEDAATAEPSARHPVSRFVGGDRMPTFEG
jgi:nucleoside-diphosphate-sugar epimerase